VFEADAPGSHIGFKLSYFFLTKAEGHLFKRALVLCEFLSHTVALPLEGFPEIFLFSQATLSELLIASAANSAARGSSWGSKSSMSCFAESRSFRWIAVPGVMEVAAAQRSLKEVERLGLRVPRIGRKRSLALRWLDPARRNRHNLLVQPLGP
jgi:hypothetical protein